MSDVIDFVRSAPASFDEANQLVGLLNRVTQKHSKTVNELIARLEALDISAREKTSAIEREVNREIEEWNTKIRKLGAIPKGLWLVDIDAGDGYYCWKYPESEIAFWHEYKGGFATRTPLVERSNAYSSSPNRLSPGSL
ncbi:MAG: hypothetical protein A2Z20_03650 [Bdellovibrionales bacterium RBG_16_40_8]|nr:MAG: hypothetical protein A2Z20_03650 [Bdellovibrionales bacterium RBG_16_40_8]